jgi:hypothetical protein
LSITRSISCLDSTTGLLSNNKYFVLIHRTTH